MKTCPVCRATLFDDMDVCYGCMHEFGSVAEAAHAAQPEEGAVVGRHARPRAEAKEGAPGELPWTVRFEVRSRDDPQACWAMELVPADRARAQEAVPATAPRAAMPRPAPAAGR